MDGKVATLTAIDYLKDMGRFIGRALEGLVNLFDFLEVVGLAIKAVPRVAWAILSLF